MGSDSKIEWTHHTFNAWRGCEKVSPGCDHCYAEALSRRNPAALGEWGPDGNRVIGALDYWDLPLKWARDAAAAGERRRVFALSLGDWLEDRPELLESRLRLLDLVRRTADHLDWLLLTKRPQNFYRVVSDTATNVLGNCDEWDETLAWIADWIIGKPPANVWLGVSAEDQERWDLRWPVLAELPAAVRFVSIEPLLGPLAPSCLCEKCGGLISGDPLACPNCGRHVWGIRPDWIIVGGESGHGARPMHPQWPRRIREWCELHGTAFFFKQWGEWATFYDRDADDPDWRNVPAESSTVQRINLAGGQGFHGDRVVYLRRVGKKAAGRELDGRTWDQFPEVRNVAAVHTGRFATRVEGGRKARGEHQRRAIDGGG